MKHPDEPLRLADDPAADPEVARVLSAARDRAPNAAQLSAMAAGLGIALPPLAPPSAPPSAPPAPPIASAAGGVSAVTAGAGVIGVTVVVASVIVAGTFGWGLPREERAPARRPPPIEAPAVDPAPLALAAPEVIAPPEAPPVLAPPPPVRRRARRPAAEEAEVVAPAQQAAPPSANELASRLRAEAALVRQAERTLAADPARALRFTEERRRLFPDGELDQEAEVVAIDALLRLGRREAAVGRARAFEAAHPGSLHARRIQRLLESRAGGASPR